MCPTADRTGRDLDALVEAVRPTLEGLERRRQEFLARRAAAWKGVALIVGGILLAGVLVTLVVGRGSFEPRWFSAFAALAVLVGGIVAYVRIAIPTGKLKTAFKREAVGAIVRAMEPGMEFFPERGVGQPEFVKSRLFSQRPDRYRAEDGLRGTIGKTRLHLSEVHAKKRRRSTDSKGRVKTHYVTIFNGIFMVADFHKHFKGVTRVLPDTAEKLFGGLGKALQDFNLFSNEDLVYLEDPEFEKTFVVYGTDQIEARYILSTSLARRILELRRKWKDDVRLSFIDSQVYVAIDHGEDLFEPKLSRSALSREQLERIVGELSACFGLVEDLNLNTRIWSKS